MSSWSESRISGGREHCSESQDSLTGGCTWVLGANATPSTEWSSTLHIFLVIGTLPVFMLMAALRSISPGLHRSLGRTFYWPLFVAVWLFLAQSCYHTYKWVIADQEAGTINVAIWEKQYMMTWFFMPLIMHSVCSAAGMMVGAPSSDAKEQREQVLRLQASTRSVLGLYVLSFLSLCVSAAVIVMGEAFSNESSLFVKQETALILATYVVLIPSLAPTYLRIEREIAAHLLLSSKPITALESMRLWKLLHIPHAVTFSMIMTYTFAHIFAGHAWDRTVLEVAVGDVAAVSVTVFCARKDLLWYWQEYQRSPRQKTE